MVFFYWLQPLDFQGAVFITIIPKSTIKESHRDRDGIIAPHSKCGFRFIGTGVRIPLSPHHFALRNP